jgi:hypothetical protein
MGIYTNGIVCGIKIYEFNDDDCTNTLFERKYETLMSEEQKKEAYLFYNGLPNKNKIFSIFIRNAVVHLI